MCEIPAVVKRGREIATEPKLLDDMERIDYERADRWENLEKKCGIRFEPRFSLLPPHYRRPGPQ